MLHKLTVAAICRAPGWPRRLPRSFFPSQATCRRAGVAGAEPEPEAVRRGGKGQELAHPVAHGPFEGVRIQQGKDAGEGIVAGRAAFEGDDGAQPRSFIAGEIGHVLEGIAAGEQAAEGDREQVGEGAVLE